MILLVIISALICAFLIAVCVGSIKYAERVKMTNNAKHVYIHHIHE